MDDLIAFVRARLAEDEAAANVALRVTAEWYEVAQQAIACTDTIEIGFAYQHIVRYDPARALREVESKRAIVSLYRKYADDAGFNAMIEDRMWTTGYVLFYLAAAWSDHPDYRQEWKQ
jgi:hypothetical protein